MNNTTTYTPPTVTPMTAADVQPQNVMRAEAQAAHNTMMNRNATRAQLAAAKLTWTRPRIDQQKPPKLKRSTNVRLSKPPQAAFAQPPGQAAAPATPVTLSAVAALLLEDK